MKKNFIILSLCLWVLLLFTGCNGPKQMEPSGETPETPTSLPLAGEGEEIVEGITMKLAEGTVSPQGLELEFLNTTDREALFGEDFILRKLVQNQYEDLPVVIEGDYGFEDIGYGLPKGEKVFHEVEWVWLYGDLEEGIYQLEKKIILRKEDGGIELVPYYVVFQIGK
ncbi:MAG TPA: hypothetical protein DEF30_09240 [Proteiniclasticum sp.]|uniref:immunoglobulin-like domain-containing protein n=1 Tax=Proteiniclasticum sp. TaxID=2053595 RepID=UPI000E97C6F3|nr:immunoglobulin-like domain-containing protein [Proteiniclasticum sp.]HBW13988.1 hypothetical protein [Proteiniclasticum sp.]